VHSSCAEQPLTPLQFLLNNLHRRLEIVLQGYYRQEELHLSQFMLDCLGRSKRTSFSPICSDGKGFIRYSLARALKALWRSRTAGGPVADRMTTDSCAALHSSGAFAQIELPRNGARFIGPIPASGGLGESYPLEFRLMCRRIRRSYLRCGHLDLPSRRCWSGSVKLLPGAAHMQDHVYLRLEQTG